MQLIVTDGCAGLAAAIQTVYPRTLHQRCWVHKMRNLREHARKRDRAQLKEMAQAIYLADSRKAARIAFRQFQLRWQREYPSLVRQFEKDLPNLLSFFSFPQHLWKQLRTTNIIERCFVEVRRRTALASPIDFDDLIAKGVLEKDAAWYQVRKPKNLPRHASIKVNRIQTGPDGTRIKFSPATKKMLDLAQRVRNIIVLSPPSN